MSQISVISICPAGFGWASISLLFFHVLENGYLCENLWDTIVIK